MVKNSRFFILAGFGLVLSLMAGLIFIGLTRITALHERMELSSRLHDAKIALVSNMEETVRERAISLHRIALITDPFERNSELSHLQRQTENFIRARDSLAATGFNPDEARIFAQLLQLTDHDKALQTRMVALSAERNATMARHLLLNEVIPVEKVVIARLNTLMNLQLEQKHQAAMEATSAYRSALLWMGLLGFVAVALGALIALYVMRRTASTERALLQEKELALVTLDSIGDGVITTDIDGKVIYSNPVAQRLTGRRLAEVKGHALRRAFNAVDAFSRQQIHHPVFDGPIEGIMVSHHENILLISHDKHEYDIECSAAPIRNPEGAVIGSVLVFRDVTEARELAKQLAWQAAHDQLTGLINRHEFDLRLTRLLEGTKSAHDQHALLYMDLDQFKLVNDTAGHAAGDELLKQLAALLRTQIQGGDTLARLGGDEFGVLLVHRSLEEALRIANLLREVVQDFRFVWDGRSFEVGASIGLVPIAAQSGNAANLMSCADAACYAAKDRGRNRVNVYSLEDIDLMQRQNEMRWVADIADAFEEKRFLLYYQPIRALCEEQPENRHCEILLRMRDVNGEIVAPAKFLPAAERYGLMPVIDRWVVRSLFSAITNNLVNAAEPDSSCVYAINLSGASLNDEFFLDFLREQITLHGISPAMLCFEITETVAISSIEHTRHFMQELKLAGCRFSLDDFGSGMSSFAYLKDLPVDYLKIDGMFVKNMVHNPIDFAMVEAINRIGHVMGIRTIAEFVEDGLILEKLRALGVNYAQGYEVGRPSPLAL